MPGFSANAAYAVITPPLGVNLLEPRGLAATCVYDDLYARTLALCDGETCLVIVTLDLVGLDLDLVDRIRRAVKERVDLPARNLMLTTTHTHSAPVTMKWDYAAQKERDREWERWMVATTADCVARAMEDPLPATLSAGRAPVQIGFNRRLSSLGGTRMAANPAGPVAPWVDVLRVDHEKGDPLAVLFSHAAHAVAVHTAGTGFSPDYPGAAVEVVRQRLGDEVVGMFAQGCCADINVNPLRGGPAESKRAGAILGNAAVDAALTAQPLVPGPFRVVADRTPLPFQPLDRDVVLSILDRAREANATLEAQGAPHRERLGQRELLLWAERMRELADREDPPNGLPFEVQGFALGPDIALVGLTHEPFVEYQLFLQNYSPFPHTMVFGYANGCADYVPTADAFALGGYEVLGGPQAYGMPALSPACEAVVKNAGMSVLEQLWSGY
jgi:hypothetical protein